MKPRSCSASWPCDEPDLQQARYAKTLLAVILRVVRDEVLAQDLLQEGLLKVWFSISLGQKWWVWNHPSGAVSIVLLRDSIS